MKTQEEIKLDEAKADPLAAVEKLIAGVKASPAFEQPEIKAWVADLEKRIKERK